MEDEYGDFDSPYLDLTEEKSSLELRYKMQEELENPINITQEFRNSVPDMNHHFKLLIRLFEYIFLYDIDNNSELDLLGDISKTEFNLDFSKKLAEGKTEFKKFIDNYNKEEKTKKHCITLFAWLVDVCFAYFIWTINEKAPFIRLPHNNLKYEVLLHTTLLTQSHLIKSDATELYKKISDKFKKLMNNPDFQIYRSKSSIAQTISMNSLDITYKIMIVNFCDEMKSLINLMAKFYTKLNPTTMELCDE